MNTLSKEDRQFIVDLKGLGPDKVKVAELIRTYDSHVIICIEATVRRILRAMMLTQTRCNR